MKKTLLKFLCLVLSAIFLISCGTPAESSTTDTTETTQNPSVEQNFFISPSDEVETTKTFTVKNEDNIEMRVLFHGYKSESLGMDFYVKSNEWSEAEVQIINRSQNTIYRYISHACGGNVLGDEDCGCEFYFDLRDDAGNQLSQDFSYCNSMLLTTTMLAIPSAISYPATSFIQDDIYLIAGIRTFKEEEMEFPVRNPLQQQNGVGIDLYDSSIYTDYIDTFSGTITFPYSNTDKTQTLDYQNECEIVCDVTLDVVYVPVNN